MADRDFAVVAHAYGGSLTKDIGPPGAGWERTQDRAFFSQSLVACHLGSHAQLAVDLMGIGVGQELVEQAVGSVEVSDVFGGEQRREPALIIEMTAFNFTLGLGGWGIAQRHPVEVKGRAQLSERVGSMGEEQGMVVDVQSQGQALRAERLFEETQMGQQGFGVIEPGGHVEAGGIVEQVQQNVFAVLKC